ncbi:flagellar protein MotY [Aeromonas caviae]|uniref:flagellar protein MotY n=1 Tax=Aeromonas caviae TaxID=648 RepID=UPI0028E02D93|nr:OmpA family protein [Aeromonas caviae]MDT8954873.1 OmpA family protein [Aeromonas caviae]
MNAWVLGLISISVSMQLQAGVTEFGAGLDQSVWRLTSDTQVECRLEHPIPRWGTGAFVSRAGRKINLDFELKGQRPQARTQTVSLGIMPPSWRPGVAGRQISQLQFYQQFDGLVAGQTAWTMLDELEGGRMPTFQYRDWYRQDRPVRVSLSSVNFRVKYQAFMDCLSGLLPYSFNDIAFSVLSYDKNSDQLSPASKQRLAMIGDYVKADKSIDVVVIDAYSDSYGGRWPNQKLSEKRADAIKQVFVDLGIEEGKISVEGHGEKQHVASNETEAGRAKNRRVVINMGRNGTI